MNRAVAQLLATASVTERPDQVIRVQKSEPEPLDSIRPYGWARGANGTQFPAPMSHHFRQYTITNTLAGVSTTNPDSWRPYITTTRPDFAFDTIVVAPPTKYSSAYNAANGLSVLFSFNPINPFNSSASNIVEFDAIPVMSEVGPFTIRVPCGRYALYSVPWCNNAGITDDVVAYNLIFMRIGYEDNLLKMLALEQSERE